MSNESEWYDNRWYNTEMVEILGSLRVELDMIYQHTMRKPDAIMLQLSVIADAEELWGCPIIRGDRNALVYEPLTRRV